jgi:hypothetical protein
MNMNELKAITKDSTDFHRTSVDINAILNKFVKCIFITRKGGDLLYLKKYKCTANIDLFSNFIAAMNIFGEENVGKIENIFIKGLNIEMKVVVKHDLIISVLFNPAMVSDYLDEECGKALDEFNQKYLAQIKAGRTNQEIFKSFDKNLDHLIREYLMRINIL